ncbi:MULTISPECIES: helix-turn-helix transcriptional regulator [unclassified Nocardia]|uniref:helix-turn-helix domain-containing protein n=1 Tax=unclassified Nocardia TaxID=2637762 RepID=UPI001CE42C83|nr:MULTISPECIES: helix-turn-helix transcriptional regulator [unclassified Nocardia]
MAVSSSTLARRALGRQMHMLRERAKIRQAEAARIIGVSAQSIGRLEDGQTTRPNDLFLNVLCDAYKADDNERRIVLALAHEVRTTHKHGGGWWRAYANAQMATGFDHYLSLEASACRLTIWATNLVPGLLQTPNYRRAIAWSEIPPLPPEAVEQRIEVMTRRQERLEDSELTVVALLSEAVLREQVGGATAMAEQARHLLKVAERENITILIVPFSAPRHLGPLIGSFSFLEFPELPQSKLPEPPIVYVEEYIGDLYLELDDEVSRYKDALAEIPRVALSAVESKNVILEAAEEYAA